MKLVHYNQTGHFAEYVDVYSPLPYTPNPPRLSALQPLSGEDEVVEEDFQEFKSTMSVTPQCHLGFLSRC
jgi:hypothetical protein